MKYLQIESLNESKTASRKACCQMLRANYKQKQVISIDFTNL